MRASAEDSAQYRSGKPRTIIVWQLPLETGESGQLFKLTTVDVRTEPHPPDGNLVHTPDLRGFWLCSLPKSDAWQLRRHICYYHQYDMECPALEGLYIIFIAVGTSKNKHDVGTAILVRGDAFVTKIAAIGEDSTGWTAYVDIAREVLSPSKSADLRSAILERVQKAMVACQGLQ